MSKKMLYIDKRLRPCPFCGAIPKIYWDDEQNVKNRWRGLTVRRSINEHGH